MISDANLCLFFGITQINCKKITKKIKTQHPIYQPIAKSINNFIIFFFFTKQKKLNLKFDWNVVITIFDTVIMKKRQQI